MAKIGFIGMGNMGYAMLKGVLHHFEPSEIIFTDVNEDRMEAVAQETGVSYAFSNAECANKAKYIVLAIKPQFYPQVLKNIQNVVREDQVVISIAPGIAIDTIKMTLGSDARIVRAMPNTPALVGEGMTGVCYEDGMLTVTEIEFIETFFASFGKMRKVDEKLLSAITCVSGSSPAYVFMFIEALADSGVKYGLARKEAYEFAAQTVLGAAKLMLETGEHPGVLKDQVCSPAGTTIAGVAALEEYGLRNAVLKATDACYAKAEGFKVN
ncbi:MAG: pyrroline-5-carboxylate reductase [Lachnospiraceae bacterium]|nr:pyrroline-5-carboxylate reductase [Lachnospiraceae bacterium]